MCGIAGIINTPDEREEKTFLDALCGAMAHRGPDGYGFFSGPGVQKTCYTTYGDVTGRICSFVFLLLFIALLVRRITSK